MGPETMKNLFSNLLIFLIALLFSRLFVFLGTVLANSLETDKTMSLVVVLGFFMYIYLKYVSVLKLENKALRMVGTLLQKNLVVENEKSEAEKDNPVPIEENTPPQNG